MTIIIMVMLHVELRIKFVAKFVHKQGTCLGFMVKKQGKKTVVSREVVDG